MTQFTSINYSADTLDIEWQNGQSSQLNALWLRDHCGCQTCRDSVSNQRLINITDLDENTKIKSASVTDNLVEIEFAPQAHTSSFTAQWLFENCYCMNEHFDDRSAQGKTLWSLDTFQNNVPYFDYSQFAANNSTKVKALSQFADYGFMLLNNLPQQDRFVLEVIKQFGYCRDTNYGEIFEVRSKVKANNLAYTNLGLGCHLDNPYRDPVPGVQLLHCLANSAEGGESILQDGFQAAQILKNESIRHFDLLSKHAINYRFSDNEADLRSFRPMIELDHVSAVRQIRFNNRSIDTIKLPPEIVPQYYQAYRHFAEILQREELQLNFKLGAGEVMVFDNTRVMHGRLPYSTGGERHLQGAYSDLDGLYSALRLLQNQLEP